MRSRRILTVLAAALTAAVIASFLIPAAVGASPKTKAGTMLCSATGTKPLGNTGVVSVSMKGKSGGSSGTPATSCAGKLTGKWAKNSTTFSMKGGTLQAKLGKGGTFKLAPGAVPPLMGSKLAGSLTGAGSSGVSDITIDWGCDISYPPLKIKCWIIINQTA